MNFAFTGCGNRLSLAALEPNVTAYGADPVINPDSFQKVDIAKALNPDGEGLQDIGFNDQQAEEKNKKNQKVLSQALKNFAESGTKADRTRLQERIISASDQRCVAYFRYLKREDVQGNFILGSLTTAFAGLGTIFTAADTVRAMAGLATVTSGVRAEFNDAFFQGLTVQVITHGINLQRKEIHDGMIQVRHLPLETYPAEAAIRDAVRYHGSCSLIAGLERAALELERADNPGVMQMQRTMFELKKLQHLANLTPKEIMSEEVQKEMARSFPGTSPEINAIKSSTLPDEVFKTAASSIGVSNDAVDDSLGEQEKKIITQFNDKKISNEEAENLKKKISDIKGNIESSQIRVIIKKFFADINSIEKRGDPKANERYCFRAILNSKDNSLTDCASVLSKLIRDQDAEVSWANQDQRELEKLKLKTLQGTARGEFNEPLRQFTSFYVNSMAKVKADIDNGELDLPINKINSLPRKLCQAFKKSAGYESKISIVENGKTIKCTEIKSASKSSEKPPSNIEGATTPPEKKKEAFTEKKSTAVSPKTTSTRSQGSCKNLANDSDIKERLKSGGLSVVMRHMKVENYEVAIKLFELDWIDTRKRNKRPNRQIK